MRRDLDRSAVRYFVYQLCDETGQPVYIGRSCHVANRLRSHYSDATATWKTSTKGEWMFDVRSVDMVGPFTWNAAVREERVQIERFQPRGNIDLTARDRRPAIAARSAAGAL